MLQTDVVLDFDVHKISINRNGTAILLFGSEKLCVMYLYGRTSKKDVNLICRYKFKSLIFQPLVLIALGFSSF